MKAKKCPKKLKTWSRLKQERFQKSPDEAIEYLKASLEENSDSPELIIEAIKCCCFSQIGQRPC